MVMQIRNIDDLDLTEITIFKGPKIYLTGYHPADEMQQILEDNDIVTIANLLPQKESSLEARVLHFPIKDYSIPEDIKKFHLLIDKLLDNLSCTNILIHCASGHGRTGMVAMGMLMNIFKENSLDDILEKVREYRSILDTDEQFEFVREYKKQFCQNREKESNNKSDDVSVIPLTFPEQKFPDIDVAEIILSNKKKLKIIQYSSCINRFVERPDFAYDDGGESAFLEKVIDIIKQAIDKYPKTIGYGNHIIYSKTTGIGIIVDYEKLSDEQNNFTIVGVLPIIKYDIFADMNSCISDSERFVLEKKTDDKSKQIISAIEELIKKWYYMNLDRATCMMGYDMIMECGFCVYMDGRKLYDYIFEYFVIID